MAHLLSVGDYAISPDDVVRTLRTLSGDEVVEHDLCGFVQRELGAFDEVREGRLIEGQYVTTTGVFGQCWQALGCGVVEIRGEISESGNTLRIEGLSGEPAGEGGGDCLDTIMSAHGS